MKTGGVRNHEGYMDLTAYRAIKNIESEEGKMEIVRGDIYEVERPDGEEQEAIVVSSQEACEANACVCIVFLCDVKPENKWDVEILAKTMMTARCGRIYNVHKNRLGGYLRTANEAEMQEIDVALAQSIGIKTGVKREGQQIAKNPREDAEEKTQDNMLEFVRIETERDIYKRMYEEMLDRMR